VNELNIIKEIDSEHNISNDFAGDSFLELPILF
jgi:hypothetical protein